VTAAPDTAGTGCERINWPEAVAEVTAAFSRYEAALSVGDAATLNALFWDSPLSVRFGVADRQQGSTEIAAWRGEHPGVPPGRRLCDTQVLAVDDRTAVVTTLFGYPDGAVEGRQTQVWVRFPTGWRIVSAHVSEVPVRCAR
jgi:hypothetical protein